MIIRFTPGAEAERAEARQWYARQREDLDLEFMECELVIDFFIPQENSLFKFGVLSPGLP